MMSARVDGRRKPYEISLPDVEAVENKPAIKPVSTVPTPEVVIEPLKSLDIPTVTEPGAKASEAPVKSTSEKRPYTWWWQTPDYLGEVERRAASAEKRAEQEKKRAKRERDMALLGDIARLGAQAYAKKGGAWKIDPFTPATEKANDKLAALRERHAAEVAAFAKARQAARQAQAEDYNTRMTLETSLASDAANREQKELEQLMQMQVSMARQDEIRRHNEAMEKIAQNKEARLGRGKKESYVVKGVEYDDIYKAYAALPKHARKKKTDEAGDATEEEDTNVTPAEMKYLVAKYNSEGENRDWIDENHDIGEVEDDFK